MIQIPLSVVEPDLLAVENEDTDLGIFEGQRVTINNLT
jgi:hypothetical protein